MDRAAKQECKTSHLMLVTAEAERVHCCLMAHFAHVVYCTMEMIT